jgi:hypothetical protein
MVRQIGLAIGVAILIAVLGSPGSPAGALVAYQRAWFVIAAIALIGGFAGLAVLAPGRTRAPAATEALPESLS